MKTNHPFAGAAAGRAMPPLAALLAFERAARLLSFRRAASELAVSPSAVSHRIRGLERRFGVRLFTRSGREVQLTAAGEQYLQHVSAGLAMLDEAGRDLMRQARRSPVELRLSALPLFASTVLIPALGLFRQRCPDVTLHIDTTHRYADFDASPVDAAIRFGREHSTGLKLEPLLPVRGLPVCSPAVARLGLRAAQDLRHHVLIHMSAQPHGWRTWLEDVGAANVVPRGEVWLDSVPAALEAAEHGMGVALAIDPLVRARKGFGTTLVAPLHSASERTETLYLVTRPERTHERNIVRLRCWLKDVVAQMAADVARPHVLEI